MLHLIQNAITLLPPNRRTFIPIYHFCLLQKMVHPSCTIYRSYIRHSSNSDNTFPQISSFLLIFRSSTFLDIHCFIVFYRRTVLICAARFTISSVLSKMKRVYSISMHKLLFPTRLIRS